MKVLQYLNSGKTLDDLYNDHKVEYTIGRNNKISFNYEQREAANDDEIAQECRGLILRFEDNKYTPVAIPFFRFFNYGQGAASISTKEEILSSKIYEKYDGTCAILYYDLGEWCVATRSIPDANIVNQHGYTFKELFDLCLKSMNCSFELFTSDLDKNHTYIFEILSPYNQIVVLHEEPKLIFIGCRNNLTFQELNIDDVSCHAEKAKQYSFSAWEDLVSFLESRPAKEGEGFVVLTPDFRRVKIKSVNYVNAHHLSSNVGSSKRNMLEAILDRMDDDLEPLIPKLLFSDLMELKRKYIALCEKIKSAYKDCIEHHNPSNKKEFALYVIKNYDSCKHFLFAIVKHGDFDTFVQSYKDVNGYSQTFLDNLLSMMEEVV